MNFTSHIGTFPRTKFFFAAAQENISPTLVPSKEPHQFKLN